MSAEATPIAGPAPLHGLAAEFPSAEALVAAARRLHAAGYTHAEAYSPFPIEDLSEALGTRRTRMATVVLIGALTGMLGGFGMQWFANVIHYTWNVGGRPPNSWPMFIPITFELAILIGATSGVIALLIMNRLPQLYHPMFHLESFQGASINRFFLCLETSDPKFTLVSARQFLESLEPLAVMEVPK